MKIMISPAKKMREDTDTLGWTALPACLDRTELLMRYVRSLTFDEQKKLWACNDAIARENAQRFSCMDLRRSLTPAILAYDGIQFASMGPSVFEGKHLEYLQEHLRILSGFYGVLKPLDGIVSYRLEMQARVKLAGYPDLYAFWGDRLYRELRDESRVIVNLASREYARCVEKHLQPGDRFITCVFGQMEGGKAVQKGVYVKMARGDMVRFLAETGAETPETMRAFTTGGYRFDDALSSESEYVFIRPGGKHL